MGTDGVLPRIPSPPPRPNEDRVPVPRPRAAADAAPIPSETTLLAIDTHFWDWIWWLATKASIGRDDLVAEHLPQLYGHLLRPMGIETVPASIDEAINAFVARRNTLEQEYAVLVPRALEDEVRRGIRRIGIPP